MNEKSDARPDRAAEPITYAHEDPPAAGLRWFVWFLAPSGWAYLEAAFHFLDDALDFAGPIAADIMKEDGALTITQGPAE